MFITQETDYAVRILRGLSEGRQLSVVELSETQLIPNAFAYKIAKKLAKHDIIKITRGAHGGCTLSRDLSEVTLYDLIQVMDGHTEVSPCFTKDYDCKWRNDHQGCNVHQKLAILQAQVNDMAKQYTIQDLLM